MLVLKDGTYSASSSGYPDVNCTGNANNGTASAPITVKAENERKAHLNGDGSVNTFQIRNCSYWVIDGLRIQSADNQAGQPAGAGSPIMIDSSSNITLRRVLASHANRWVNVAGIQLVHSSYLLIEENELYNFHRNGISANSTNNSIFRRNYINSRRYSDLAGCTGYPIPEVVGTPRCSGPPYAGDTGIVLYPGSYNIIENNISEGQGDGFEIQAAYGPATNNQFLGNISINDGYGIGLFARSENSGVQQMPQNTIVKDMV
jgi:nitrous oxidase accessory protein NosD